MPYKCPYCDFESLNKKNLEIHIKEEHSREIEKEQRKEEDKVEEGKEKEKAKAKVKAKEINDFSRGWYGENVTLTFLDGSQIEGKMKGYSKYEFLIEPENDEEEIIVFKGAVKTMVKV
jgi:sRNA-binding regulator protein Hfq